jgi:hypothetical protein
LKVTVKILLFLCTTNIILITDTPASGQTKYEREYRIKAVELAIRAVQFIDSIDIQGKIKWYYEENLEGNSVEAKFIHHSRNYSVEFDTLGILQDIEIIMDWMELPKNTRERVTLELDSCFTKHKIKKIQIQHSGDISAMLALLKGEIPQVLYTTQYEMVIKGKTDARPKLFEITFSEEGKILEINQIIFKNTDNLEF